MKMSPLSTLTFVALTTLAASSPINKRSATFPRTIGTLVNYLVTESVNHIFGKEPEDDHDHNDDYAHYFYVPTYHVVHKYYNEPKTTSNKMKATYHDNHDHDHKHHHHSRRHVEADEPQLPMAATDEVPEEAFVDVKQTDLAEPEDAESLRSRREVEADQVKEDDIDKPEDADSTDNDQAVSSQVNKRSKRSPTITRLISSLFDLKSAKMDKMAKFFKLLGGDNSDQGHDHDHDAVQFPERNYPNGYYVPAYMGIEPRRRMKRSTDERTKRNADPTFFSFLWPNNADDNDDNVSNEQFSSQPVYYIPTYRVVHTYYDYTKIPSNMMTTEVAKPPVQDDQHHHHHGHVHHHHSRRDVEADEPQLPEAATDEVPEEAFLKVKQADLDVNEEADA